MTKSYNVASGVVEDAAVVLLEGEGDSNSACNGSTGSNLSHHVGLAGNLTVLGDVDLGRVGHSAAATRGRAGAADVLGNTGLSSKCEYECDGSLSSA